MSFCQDFQIDYFVINQTHFDPAYLAQNQFFFQPYNDLIINMVATVTDYSTLVMPKLTPSYENAPYVIIKCDAAIMGASKV